MRYSALKYGLIVGCAALPLMGCSVTPKPLSGVELAHLSTSNFQRVTIGDEAINGPISLYEAMARGLKYNLDYRVEMMQASLRSSEIVYASAQMLPQLVSKAGYTARDSFHTTSSLDIPTGIEVKQDLASQDKAYNDADVSFSWNVLDFALSYVRANQAADGYLIAQEIKRKIVQQILQDVRSAYWRSIVSDRMLKKLALLERRAKKAAVNARATALQGAESPLTALTYERELVKIRQNAENIQDELSVARSQLAALIGLPPGSKFELINDDITTLNISLNLSADEMVAEAIFNRAEIREIAYQVRINKREATAALLEILPGLKLNGANAFNDNQFLLNNNWLSWGVSAADNLIKVAQLPAKRAAIDAGAEVLDQKALAMTMVIMTQVHVGRIRYHHFVEELETAKDYLKAQSALVKQLKAQAAADLIGEQTTIREEMNELVAEVQRDIAYGNVHNASATLLVSMGLDIQAKEIDLGTDLKTLANHLRAVWADRHALSDRAKYLAELEKAREEARRKKEEEERRKREEAKRIAAEEQRIKEEKALAVRVAAANAKEEAAKAKRDAIERAKAETKRLKQEAQNAAVEAKKAQKNAVSRSRNADSQQIRTIEWVWPWDSSASKQLPEDKAVQNKNSRKRRNMDEPYTGTK